MERMKTDLKHLDSEEIVEEAAQRLKNKEVIVYPTDTVYGLGCLSTVDQTVERVFEIKQREKHKPLLVLASDIGMASDFFDIDEEQKKVLNKYWPGPYTFLLKEKGYFSPLLKGDDGTTGVRLPKNEFIIKMVHRVGEPIVSTSLNVSGRDILDSPRKIESEFSHHLPDTVIDIGEIKKGRPSTLMDLTDPKDLKVLR